MGLYDSFKLDNSTYISQYVGSVVPELQNFSIIKQNQYNQAADADDILTEAMGNMSHLDMEEDAVYANELKQKYIAGLMERAKRGDYENMGRRTRRDAQGFAQEYKPLIQRQQGMATIQERVMQDEKIFSPEKKQQILGRIRAMNTSPRNPDGSLIRDANGRVALGAIKDWAYAKDVDVNKKLAEFLSKMETDVRQSGYTADGSGALVSSKVESRDPQEIARLAYQYMQSDPEVRAMIERDVDLATYNLTPEDISRVARENNKSTYDKLKAQGLPDSMIASRVAASGLSRQDASRRPLDQIRQAYIDRGGSVQGADVDFVRNIVRQQLMEPNANLIAQVLKVDKRTLEARTDPNAIGAAIGAALNSGKADGYLPISVTSDAESASQEQYMDIHNAYVNSSKALNDTKGNLQTAIGLAMGMPNPEGKKPTVDWFNNTAVYLKDKNRRGELIRKLQSEGKEQDAINLERAFSQYDQTLNTAEIARQKAESVHELIDVGSLYNEYRKEEGAKALSRKDFEESLRDQYEIKQSNLFRQGKYSRADLSITDEAFNRKESDAMQMARWKYFQQAQEKIPTVGTNRTVMEPLGPGALKSYTDAVTDQALAGTLQLKEEGSGTDMEKIWEQAYTENNWAPWNKTVSEKEKRDPSSDYNKMKAATRFKFVAERSGAGEVMLMASLPNGRQYTMAAKNINPALANELAIRYMDEAGKSMTSSQHRALVQPITRGIGRSIITRTSPAEVENMSPNTKSSPYILDDAGMYALQIKDTGIEGVGSKGRAYTLLVRSGDQWVETNIKNKTKYEDIEQAISEPTVRAMISGASPSQSGLFNR